jgi:acid phosphatase family membrane protein YuiD
MKPVVKAGRSEVKLSVSAQPVSCFLKFIRRRMDWRKKMSMKLMPSVRTVQVSSMKTTTVKIGFDTKKA